MVLHTHTQATSWTKDELKRRKISNQKTRCDVTRMCVSARRLIKKRVLWMNEWVHQIESTNIAAFEEEEGKLMIGRTKKMGNKSNTFGVSH